MDIGILDIYRCQLIVDRRVMHHVYFWDVPYVNIITLSPPLQLV